MEEVKEVNFTFVLISSIVYFIVSSVAFAIGINDRFYNKKCETPITRIEVLFPAYRVGCWFGEDL